MMMMKTVIMTTTMMMTTSEFCVTSGSCRIPQTRHQTVGDRAFVLRRHKAGTVFRQKWRH